MLTSQKITEIESTTKMIEASIDKIICNGSTFTNTASIKLTKKEDDLINTTTIIMSIEDIDRLSVDLDLFCKAIKAGGVDGLL